MNIRILFYLLFLANQCIGQSINKEITNQGKSPYLLGKINKEGLTSANYYTWFLQEFDTYKPQQEVISKISKQLKKYKIVVFMGTWCGDSRREVPRFYKLLEAANYPMHKLTVVALSNTPEMYKQSPAHEEKGLNIHRVPVFIFYKKGKEVNRIIESPIKTLEDDIYSILNEKYIPNYKLVTEVNKIIDTKNFYTTALANLSEYKKYTNNMYALNTYAHILKTTNRKEKALDVLKLNTKLFPEKAAVYVSLANTFFKLGKKNEALENYKKAAQLNPQNKKLKETISRLKSEVYK